MVLRFEGVVPLFPNVLTSVKWKSILVDLLCELASIDSNHTDSYRKGSWPPAIQDLSQNDKSRLSLSAKTTDNQRCGQKEWTTDTHLYFPPRIGYHLQRTTSKLVGIAAEGWCWGEIDSSAYIIREVGKRLPHLNQIVFSSYSVCSLFSLVLSLHLASESDQFLDVLPSTFPVWLSLLQVFLVLDQVNQFADKICRWRTLRQN